MLGFTRYHFYISIEGDEAIFKEFFEFLESVSARQLYGYPIWFFRSEEENEKVYVNKLIEIFTNIQKVTDNDHSVSAKWQILFMGPSGHNGFSAGGPFEE